MSEEPSLEEKLAALQVKFKGQLQERFDAIAVPWQDYLQGHEPEALKAMHMAAHKMAGSAATFGFAEISKLAKEAELALDGFVNDGAGQVDTQTVALVNDRITRMQVLVETA